MYRPPGLLRIRPDYFDGEQAKPSTVDIEADTMNAQVSFGNTKDVEQNKQNFKQKVEKSIWMTIPTRSLYQRENKDSDLLKIANKNRFEEILLQEYNAYRDRMIAKGKENEIQPLSEMRKGLDDGFDDEKITPLQEEEWWTLFKVKI